MDGAIVDTLVRRRTSWLWWWIFIMIAILFSFATKKTVTQVASPFGKTFYKYLGWDTAGDQGAYINFLRVRHILFARVDELHLEVIACRGGVPRAPAATRNARREASADDEFSNAEKCAATCRAVVKFPSIDKLTMRGMIGNLWIWLRLCSMF